MVVVAQRLDAKGIPQVDHRAVVGLAIPLILSASIQALMGITDTWFIGQISSQALAGMNAAWLPTLVALGPFINLGRAVQTLVAQTYAAGDPKGASGHAWSGVGVGLALFPLCGLLSIFGGLLYAGLPLPEGVSEQASAYWQIRVWGGSALLGTFSLSGFFNGIGRTWVTLCVSGCSVLLNGVLNALFIFGFGWGIGGAAWGTILSEYVELSLYLLVFLSGWIHRSYASRHTWNRGWNPLAATGRIRPLLKLGLPIWIYSLADMSSFTLFQLMIGQVGAVEGATAHICLMLSRFAYLPAIGLEQSATVLVGQAIGSGQPNWAKRLGNAVMGWTLGYMAVIGGTLALFGQPLISLFVSEVDANAASIIRLGGLLLKIIGVSFLFDGINFAALGSLRGAGDVRVPMVIMLGMSWLVFLPLAQMMIFPSGQSWLPFLPGLGWGAVGGWLAVLIYVAGLGSLMVSRWRSGIWQKTSL
ncbi:MATE family efflux transporter [Thermostichus vulcanus]|uniref:Probable multidrug resistance protein NorM n=1 Tax=Thermostichus vulcanus str. 'Rupite' TaxID=2813851 RepID=A0ABT0CDN7_THEVL|nr:MATE family efflux transporter [Thermostichus vulcanus]MCJ2543883.1 MATE family efflux transporter [Thermostichus vulcanus str. 'Rupite']